MTNSDDVRLDIETTRQQSRYAAVENRGAEGHPRGETHTMRAQALMQALVTGPPLTESAYITVSPLPPLSSPAKFSFRHQGHPERWFHMWGRRRVCAPIISDSLARNRRR